MRQMGIGLGRWDWPKCHTKHIQEVHIDQNKTKTLQCSDKARNVIHIQMSEENRRWEG